MFTDKLDSVSTLKYLCQAHPRNEAVRPSRAAADLTSARLLTRDDICRMFGISVRTTHYWIQQGLLPEPICIGAKRYWQIHHINEMLKKHGGVPIAEVTHPEPALCMPEERGRAAECEPKPRRKPKKPSAVRAVSYRAESKCEEIKRRLGLL